MSVEAAKLQGAYVDPRNSKLRFAQVVDDYKKTRRSSPATQARDDSALSVHVLPRFGNMPLGAIDRRQVQEWVFGLEQKGLAPSTIKREFQALQKVFTWAVDEEELLVRNPCRRIRFPSAQNEQSTERRVYRPEEIEKLYEAFDARYRAMVLVGCYAGLRIGEQAALRVEDVSFAERRIHVRQGLTEVGGRTAIGPLKTKHSRGRVEIPKFLAEELDRHIHANGNDIGFVFASPEGKLLRPSLWRQRFWHPAVTASIGQPAQPHDMRHTFVSTLIAQGLSVEKVCEQARHSDPAFTWRVYKHDFDKRTEAMAEALAGLDLLRSSAASNTIASPR